MSSHQHLRHRHSVVCLTPMSQHPAAAAQVARVGRSVGLAAILKKEHRMSNHRTSISGLTDEEAQEFHHFWIQGTVAFTAVAVLAHILVWAWRPWL